MYQHVKRTCRTCRVVVLLIEPIVLCHSCCRCRRPCFDSTGLSFSQLLIPNALTQFSVSQIYAPLYNPGQEYQWTVIFFQGFHTAMYASSWFLTLFASVFPLNAAFRIMDVFICEVQAFFSAA